MGRKPGKLNVIWFHDEQPAKRLRLRPGWIRAVTYFLVLAVLAAAGGVFAAYQFWTKAQETAGERREVEKRLSEALLKLERLQNIEKLLQTSDPTELNQLLAGLGLEPAARAQAQGKNANAKDAPKEAPKDSSKDAPKPAAPEREKPAGFDLAEVVGKVDLGQVGVENFKGRLDAKGAHCTFDLSNLQPQPMAGAGQLLAVMRDGVIVPLQTGKDELNFSIQRFKQVTALAQLPKGLDPAGVFGLRIVLSSSAGKIIFSETYPLASAQ